MADKKKSSLLGGLTGSSWSLALTGGLELAVSVLGCVWFGIWLDKKLKSSPWFLLCGAILGMTVGIYQIVRISKKKNDTAS